MSRKPVARLYSSWRLRMGPVESRISLWRRWSIPLPHDHGRYGGKARKEYQSRERRWMTYLKGFRARTSRRRASGFLAGEITPMKSESWAG